MAPRDALVGDPLLGGLYEKCEIPCPERHVEVDTRAITFLAVITGAPALPRIEILAETAEELSAPACDIVVNELDHVVHFVDLPLALVAR